MMEAIEERKYNNSTIHIDFSVFILRDRVYHHLFTPLINDSNETISEEKKEITLV